MDEIQCVIRYWSQCVIMLDEIQSAPVVRAELRAQRLTLLTVPSVGTMDINECCLPEAPRIPASTCSA